MTPELKYWLLILLTAIYTVPTLPKWVSWIFGITAYGAALLVFFGVLQ